MVDYYKNIFTWLCGDRLYLTLLPIQSIILPTPYLYSKNLFRFLNRF